MTAGDIKKIVGKLLKKYQSDSDLIVDLIDDFESVFGCLIEDYIVEDNYDYTIMSKDLDYLDEIDDFVEFWTKNYKIEYNEYGKLDMIF